MTKEIVPKKQEKHWLQTIVDELFGGEEVNLEFHARDGDIIRYQKKENEFGFGEKVTSNKLNFMQLVDKKTGKRKVDLQWKKKKR